MARIQQSIDVGVPAHAAYQQLIRFEDYPRFMQEVDTVQRIDNLHLHWSANMSLRTLEWDAEITDQQPDRCIAWRNIGGPIDAERIELQPLGPSKSRVTMTMECDPQQLIPAQENNADQAVAERLRDDLERFKSWVETNGAEASAMLHATREISEAMRKDRAADDKPPATSSYAAGSEGWDGSEDPSQPATSSSHYASEGPGWSNVQSGSQDAPQSGKTTQSDYSLSQSQEAQAGAGADEERFSVAEEQSFDQQSDQARRIGQAMSDPGAMDADGTQQQRTPDSTKEKERPPQDRRP